MTPPCALVCLSALLSAGCGAAETPASTTLEPAEDSTEDSSASASTSEPSIEADNCDSSDDRRWDPYSHIQATAEDLEEFLRLNRELFARTCHDHVDVRFRMLHKMGEHGDGEAVPLLVAALDDEESSIRDEAARSLAAIGAPEATVAVPRLRALLAALSEGGDPSALRAALDGLEGVASP